MNWFPAADKLGTTNGLVDEEVNKSCLDPHSCHNASTSEAVESTIVQVISLYFKRLVRSAAANCETTDARSSRGRSTAEQRCGGLIIIGAGFCVCQNGLVTCASHRFAFG